MLFTLLFIGLTTVVRYPKIAERSSLVILPYMVQGMTVLKSPVLSLVFRTAESELSRNNLIKSSLVQLPIPVSLSGVMLLEDPMDPSGFGNSLPPPYSVPAINCPLSALVWHSMHPAAVVMYFP